MRKEIILFISVLVALFLFTLVTAPFVALPVNSAYRSVQQPPPVPEKSQGPEKPIVLSSVVAPLIPVAAILELLILFFPFVFIEARMIEKLLHAAPSKSFRLSLLMNSLTSIIVLPLAYIVYLFLAGFALFSVMALGWSGGEGPFLDFLGASFLVLLAMITGFVSGESAAANLITYVGVSLILLIPAYLLVVYIESRILQKAFPYEKTERLPAADIETEIIQKLFPAKKADRMLDMSYRINLYSFCALAVVSMAYSMIKSSGLF